MISLPPAPFYIRNFTIIIRWDPGKFFSCCHTELNLPQEAYANRKR
jgi:hypothetical protein